MFRINSINTDKTQEWASRFLRITHTIINIAYALHMIYEQQWLENVRLIYIWTLFIRTNLQNQPSYLLSLKITGYLSKTKFTGMGNEKWRRVIFSYAVLYIPGARFSKVQKFFGRISGDIILPDLLYLQNEGVSRHETLQLI